MIRFSTTGEACAEVLEAAEGVAVAAAGTVAARVAVAVGAPPDPQALKYKQAANREYDLNDRSHGFLHITAVTLIAAVTHIAAVTLPRWRSSQQGHWSPVV
jgi:hypothetical protein